MTKFAQVAPDAFEKIQLNAGVLLTEFDPETGTIDRTKIFAQTGGGVSFAANIEYIDFGEDIDNVPVNTKELKRIDSVTPVLSGTLRTVDSPVAKSLMAAATVSGNKLTPTMTLTSTDFFDLWWVGDYSEVNTGEDAGFLAIKLINALSTGGFQLQSNDKGKGDFSFEYTGHYSIANIDVVPYELYVKGGE